MSYTLKQINDHVQNPRTGDVWVHVKTGREVKIESPSGPVPSRITDDYYPKFLVEENNDLSLKVGDRFQTRNTLRNLTVLSVTKNGQVSYQYDDSAGRLVYHDYFCSFLDWVQTQCAPVNVIKTSDSFLIKRNGQVCKLSYFKKGEVYVIYVDGLFQTSIRTETEFDCFLNSLQIVNKAE